MAPFPNQAGPGNGSMMAVQIITPVAEEAEVLEVRGPPEGQRRLVEGRHVPCVEGDRPGRQRDQRMGEKPEPADQPEREDRAKDGPTQAEHERQRRQVAEHQVLDHVDVEGPLLADRVDR